jgi:hypothetical protein
MDSDFLPPLAQPCEKAMSIQVALLEQGVLDSESKAFFGKHLAECASCRERRDDLALAQQSLQNAFAKVIPAPDFASRVMTAISATQVPSRAVGQSHIFAAAPRRRVFSLARLAAACLLALAGLAAAVLLSRREVVVCKGDITDSNGRTVSALRVGQPYQVKKTAVLDFGGKTRVKAEAGTEFQLETGASASKASFKLASGQVYAANQERPLRVACDNFETSLEGGDFFVGQEARVSCGVVIVFKGRAQVKAQRKQALPVLAGQVFVCVGSEYCDKFELQAMQQVEERKLEVEANLHAAYRARIEGYRQEAGQLEKELAAAPLDSPRHTDLADRYERVGRYLQIHQRRLEELTADQSLKIPFEKIKSGVKGYTDPAAWL